MASNYAVGLMVFLVNMLVGGFLFSLTWLTEALRTTFTIDPVTLQVVAFPLQYTQVYTIISLHAACTLLATCLMIYLPTTKYEHVLGWFALGGIFWCVGILLCSVSGDYTLMVLSLGVMSGLGCGLAISAVNRFSPSWTWTILMTGVEAGVLVYCLAAGPHYTVDLIHGFVTKQQQWTLVLQIHSLIGILVVAVFGVALWFLRPKGYNGVKKDTDPPLRDGGKTLVQMDAELISKVRRSWPYLTLAAACGFSAFGVFVPFMFVVDFMRDKDIFGSSYGVAIVMGIAPILVWSSLYLSSTFASWFFTTATSTSKARVT